MAVRTSQKAGGQQNFDCRLTKKLTLMKNLFANLGFPCGGESFAAFSFAFEPKGNILGINFGQK